MRRTLAFSIHELAVILGDQLTAADLVPIFNGFLKDLDEVRIGVLKHLYDFLKVRFKDSSTAVPSVSTIFESKITKFGLVKAGTFLFAILQSVFVNMMTKRTQLKLQLCLDLLLEELLYMYC